MVVCKFFLQGTCKFGAYCHFEHQIPSGYNYTKFNDNNQQSTSILRQTNFGNAQNTKTPTTSNVDANTLVKSVVTDMMGAEKGGQWLLSYYAPFKEKPAFPGFEDQSPEEIRFGFYEAQKNGTMDQYKQQLQVLLQNTIVKVRALQNPSPDVIAILKNIYNSPASSLSGTYGQSTTLTNASNIFSQQSSNIFANQNKLFGKANDVFNTNTQQNNGFGTGLTKNLFDGTTTQAQSNIFVNSIPQITTPDPNQNRFGGNHFIAAQNTGFENQPSNNIFNTSRQTPDPSKNIFGVKNSNPPAFNNPQQSTNIFTSPSQTTQPENIFRTQGSYQPSIFEQQNKPITQNIFATQNQSPQNVKIPLHQGTLYNPNMAPPNYSASVFGNAVNTNPSIGFSPATEQSTDTSLYSDLNELDAKEKTWFESDTLDIFNIPDKPPTYDMCFK